MIAAVLFDLDGTIVNTNELIMQSFLHVLEGNTPQPVTREMLIPHMGHSLSNQLKLFSGRTDVEDLMEVYRKINVEMHDRLVEEFPYVREVLQQLKERNIRMGVVTNKVRKTAEMGLKFCGLNPYMDAVITIDDVVHPKPHPESVLKALEILGTSPEETLMVGDSQFDIQAAQNAGVLSAGVAWSVKGEAFLAEYHPDYMIRDMRELLAVVGSVRC